MSNHSPWGKLCASALIGFALTTGSQAVAQQEQLLEVVNGNGYNVYTATVGTDTITLKVADSIIID